MTVPVVCAETGSSASDRSPRNRLSRGTEFKRYHPLIITLRALTKEHPDHANRRMRKVAEGPPRPRVATTKTLNGPTLPGRVPKPADVARTQFIRRSNQSWTCALVGFFGLQRCAPPSSSPFWAPSRRASPAPRRSRPARLLWVLFNSFSAAFTPGQSR